MDFSGIARGEQWGRFTPGGTFWGGGKIEVIPKNKKWRGSKKRSSKKNMEGGAKNNLGGTKNF